MDGGFVCPMCGIIVSANVSECPGCGEQFSPVEDNTTETVVEETEETFVNDDIPVEDERELGICEVCDTPLNEFGKCPTCQPPEKVAKTFDGCPLCESKNYTVETGDLVACSDCGNVYVLKDFEPSEQNWKWKFWVGLLFILVGNVGVALGSYIHNVLQWSPLGALYLGYGRFDQIVGAIGIIVFFLGLLLFALSFKREREVTCPACKVVVRESQFEIFEPEEEEVEVPKEDAVKSALAEIGEMMECPSCRASVSMFDTACSNCGTVFEMEMEAEFGELEPAIDDTQAQAPSDRFLTASEIDEDRMITDSLALEEETFELDDSLELDKPQEHLETNGLTALDELESAFQVSMDEGRTCSKCGARVGKGLDTCPGCGESLTDGE